MRKEPYTEIGIKRIKCCRCGVQAYHQFNICADGYKAICRDCDIELNKLVLQWIGDKEWKKKIKYYQDNM